MEEQKHKVSQKHKAKEFYALSARIIIIVKIQVWSPEEMESILALSVVLSQSLDKDLRKLGVLWGKGGALRPCCHSVLGSFLSQFRY